MNRTLFIGDVHGCYDEMEKMLDIFGFVKGSDTVYFTGDLINKGPDSIRVIQTIVDNGFLCVKGNHEARLLKLVATPSELWTEKEKEMAKTIGEPEWIANVVKDWPLWRDTPQALLVHAGLEPGKTCVEDMDPNILLSIRTWDGKGENLNCKKDTAWFECVKWPKLVIFGHWAVKGLVDIPGFRGLDSGCVYGKFLSAFCPEENRLYKVPAAKVYSLPKIKKAKLIGAPISSSLSETAG